MAIYFVFSDEAGKYIKALRSNNNKYFVRSAIIFNAEHWIEAKTQFDYYRTKAGIPSHKELKWNYLASLRSFRKQRKDISEKEPFYFLKDISEKDLIDFIKNTIKIFHCYDDTKIIYTITFNKPEQNWILKVKDRIVSKGTNSNPKENHIYKWHLQELMQRIEMDMAVNNNLALLFFDQDKVVLLFAGFLTLHQYGVGQKGK